MKGILAKDGHIGYVDIPKCASTSMKELFLHLDYDENYLQSLPEKSTNHDFYQKRKKNIDDAEVKLLIIRDPVERFISAYHNRVWNHREITQDKINKLPYIDRFRLKPVPNIHHFIKYFEKYRKIKTIHWHLRSITELTQNNIEYFTHIYKINQLDECMMLLSTLYGKEIAIQKLQKGKQSKPTIGVLNKREIKKIIKLFECDYKLLKDYYSAELIWKKWELETKKPSRSSREIIKLFMRKLFSINK